MNARGIPVGKHGYVLIPGAWHGAWSWRPVAERLRAAGHRTITLTLPGLNDGDDPSGHRLEDAVNAYEAALQHNPNDGYAAGRLAQIFLALGERGRGGVRRR